ncbi:MAG TPA: hypothetical protein VJU78_11585 [Chitinophagaceae bacterium]|nr:hypothetical protein [Chitinophagaceae bacterium]
MQKIKTTLFLSACMLLSLFVQAQNSAKTTFGETMRSNGRIYVVIAVMLTILVGLILYLVRLDRKITKIEKDIQQ